MSARSHPRRLIVALATGSLMLLASLAGWSGSAQAAGAAFSPATCVTTPSTVVPGVQIADPACEFNGAAYTGPFSPIANGSGQPSQVWTGIASDGAAYRIEVPPDWNGTLVMYAHGFGAPAPWCGSMNPSCASTSSTTGSPGPRRATR